MSDLLSTLARSRPAERPDWIGQLRDRAFAVFEEQGVPTRRLESWKGTSFAPLSDMAFAERTRTGVDAVAPTQAPSASRPELVFLDGRLDERTSRHAELPAGLRILTLAEAIATEPELLEGRLAALADPKLHSLVALNTAFLEDGLVLVLDPGLELDTPLRLRFTSTADAPDAPSACFPRLLLIAHERSAATLFLEHESIGSAPGFTDFVAEIFAGRRARIELVQIQAEDAARVHFTSLHARLEGEARFDSHVFSLGEGLARSEIATSLVEPGAQTTMRGLFLGRESSHIDHFTTVDHVADHCTSDQEYRGVLDDRSKGVFRGRVIIRPGAQKTETSQSNPNLLLSEHATIDTKPQLEIYADDVRASHGSTIGQLDPDALFFLRSRGIDPAQARRLLTGAFTNAIAERIAHPELREEVTQRIEASLAKLTPARTEISSPPGKDPSQ